MEKEQTTFDVQIGDGMDIGIMGENGEFLRTSVTYNPLLRRCQEPQADGGAQPLPGGFHHELLPKQHVQLPESQHF